MPNRSRNRNIEAALRLYSRRSKRQEYALKKQKQTMKMMSLNSEKMAMKMSRLADRLEKVCRKPSQTEEADEHHCPCCILQHRNPVVDDHYFDDQIDQKEIPVVPPPLRVILSADRVTDMGRSSHVELFEPDDLDNNVGTLTMADFIQVLEMGRRKVEEREPGEPVNVPDEMRDPVALLQHLAGGQNGQDPPENDQEDEMQPEDGEEEGEYKDDDEWQGNGIPEDPTDPSSKAEQDAAFLEAATTVTARLMDYARSEIQMLNDNGGGVKVMVMEVPGGEFHIIPDEYNSEKEDDRDGMIGEGLIEENPMEDGPIQGELVEDGQVSLDGPLYPN